MSRHNPNTFGSRPVDMLLARHIPPVMPLHDDGEDELQGSMWTTLTAGDLHRWFARVRQIRPLISPFGSG